MAKLPRDLSGRDVRAALKKIGFIFRHQRGSHMVLRRDDPPARVVVPFAWELCGRSSLMQG